MPDPIQSFYERYPHPAPRNEIAAASLDKSSPFEGCPDHFFHIFWPQKKFTLDLDILIAGCGTAEAVIHALRCPGARITAIDVSKTSLENSWVLAKKYHATNIDFHLLEIENVSKLDKQFDLICCAGVLHHLASPIVGIKALRSVLKPEASISMMLYGKYGRAGIYMLQETMARSGLTADNITDETLRDIQTLVKGLDPLHPLELQKKIDPSDFEILNHTADIIMNPRDAGFTVPMIYDLLRDSGMALQSWYYRYCYTPSAIFKQRTPLFHKVNALPTETRYAIGELLRGSITRHCFVCCSDERKKESYVCDIAADNWKNLIPVLNPTFVKPVHDLDLGTIPPNGQAALQSGHYKLYGGAVLLAIDQVEFLRAMDGVKNLSQLQADVPDSYLQGFSHYLYENDVIEFRKPVL